MSALKYWLWLSCLEKISKSRRHGAMKWFGDPERLYRADEKSLKYVEGLTDSDIAALLNKDMTGAEKVLADCAEKGVAAIAMQDALYPGLLRNIEDPPFVLYVLGNLPDLENEIPIAMVGSRKCSVYGQLTAKRLGYQISRCGGLVVSGMAEGVDGMAHQGALLAGARTVAVLGCGVDVVYPKVNKNLYQDIIAYGAVVSEYPPGTGVKAEHFPVRNRIISGMCWGTLVVECAEKSGALITAKTALEQGRDVFAVPGNIDNPACVGSNQLLREGAGLVTCGWDIIREYASLRPEKAVFVADAVEIRLDSVKPLPPAVNIDQNDGQGAQKAAQTRDGTSGLDKKVIDKVSDKAYIQRIEALGPDEKAIVEAIGDKTRHVDDIIDMTQMKAARVLASLTLLEIQGVVEQCPGKKYKCAR